MGQPISDSKEAKWKIWGTSDPHSLPHWSAGIYDEKGPWNYSNSNKRINSFHNSRTKWGCPSVFGWTDQPTGSPSSEPESVITVRKRQGVTYGNMRFRTDAETRWNNLTLASRKCNTLSIFKEKVKINLFISVYSTWTHYVIPCFYITKTVCCVHVKMFYIL